MATALMIDDRLQIDGFDPYTWSGTYGVNTDGFPKGIYMDGSYFTQVDETPMEVTESPENTDSPEFNNSGAMYLKTASVDPAPFRMFPARKFEYSDGRVTWFRPDLPWSWMSRPGQGDILGRWIQMKGLDGLFFWVALLVLVIFVFMRRQKA